MVEEARFFERQIDRTAYSALWFVAIFAIIVWIALACLIWEFGTLIQHHHLTWHIPSWHLQLPNPAHIVESEQQKANQAASNAAQSAATSAANSAKAAVSAQLTQFLGK